ncbi:MAG TPA: hypothetical protein PK156_14560 [Polyangium sp.]|nr:hypothetical protein [Polyangium sp.]
MTARTRPEQARPDGTRGFGTKDAERAGDRHGQSAFERSSFMRRTLPCAKGRFVLSTCVGAALLTLSSWACADDLQQFELGKTRFDGGEYDKAADRFAAMLDPAQMACAQAPANAMTPCRLSDPDLIERARAYYAASLVALNRNDEADLQIAEILRKNFQFAPDPAAFPAKVVDRFTVVRGRLRQELEAEQEKRAQQERAQRLAAERAKQAEDKWLAMVLRAASEERVIVKNSRFIASLPFGIGQFQNRNSSLGTAFAVSESLLGAITVVTSVTQAYYTDAYYNPRYGAEQDTLGTNRLISIRLNQIAFGAFAAVAVTGIVQAQIAFVPQFVTVNKRPVPPRPTTSSLFVMPTLGLSKDMFGVGLVGTF